MEQPVTPQTQNSNKAKPVMRPETSAWMILLTFFGLFCIIVAGTGYLGWNYYSTAMVPMTGTLLRVHANAGITIQSKRSPAAESLDRLPADRDPCANEVDICRLLAEGDSVRAKREAGYGQVASIVLPDAPLTSERTQIDMWAHPTGAELVLERFQATTWTQQRQVVQLRQDAGYIRYDIGRKQTYAEVEYTVVITGGARVTLATGGSYSINVARHEPGRIAIPAVTGKPLMAEIAVRRTGRAVVRYGNQRVTVEPGHLIQLDSSGALSSPQPGRWELIADGNFTGFSQPNNAATDVEPWKRYWNFNAPGIAENEKNGRFNVLRACRPETPDLCTPTDQVFIGQFRREGDQTKTFITGIEQPLDTDVSEYTSLRLTAWVRVLTQTVELAGVAGSECPIMIQLVYKQTSPTDQQQNRYFCVYTAGASITGTPIGPVDNSQEAGEIRYRQVPAWQWYRIDVELRDDTLLKQARYLQTLRIEARGHDYLSEVTEVSLVGTQ